MKPKKTLNLLGYASGVAGADPASAEGPLVMQRSPFMSALEDKGLDILWKAMIKAPADREKSTKLETVTELCCQLAVKTSDLVRGDQPFIVLGGDHSSAIGTWSGAEHAKNAPIGLIWIDAHMDSHTFRTSPSGNMHGMPLACLLGHGEESLIHILNKKPKLLPQHVCLIGVRRFESGEAELLEKLRIRIFYMEEVQRRGMRAIFSEALSIATNGTAGYGLSIDLDAIDPEDAPGTGVKEPNGIRAKDLIDAIAEVAHDERFLGAEIVEFDPARDINKKTEKLIADLIASITLGS